MILRKASVMAIAALFVLPSAVAQSGQDAVVRVLVASGIEEVRISGRGGDLDVETSPSSGVIATLQNGQVAGVAPSRSHVRVEMNDQVVNMDRATFRPSPGAHAVVHSGNRSTAYSGIIEVSLNARGRLVVTNTLEVEDYVSSVVASEYNLETGEGMRAMAIVARTFALATSRANGEGIRGQAYGGADAVTDASRDAAASTRGQILVFEGTPIEALYSASNGGFSASSADVWGGDALSYMPSRADPYDRSASPHINWSSSLERSDVIKALRAEYGSRIDDFKIERRGPDGRVRDVILVDDRGGKSLISANSFRLAVTRRLGANALRSTLFELRSRGNSLEFTGSGYGHGVGLSQWGTYAMAREGRNARQILDFYYPGTNISAERDASSRFPVAAAIAEVPPTPTAEHDESVTRTTREATTSVPVIDDSDRSSPPRHTSVGWTAAPEETRGKRARRVGW